jgi:hypothetical protein
LEGSLIQNVFLQVCTDSHTTAIHINIMKEKIPNLFLSSSFKQAIGVPGATTEGKRWEYGWQTSHDGYESTSGSYPTCKTQKQWINFPTPILQQKHNYLS